MRTKNKNIYTMNLKAQTEMKQELLKQETVAGIFDVFNKYYDTEHCETGPVLKNLLIIKLGTLVRTTGAKARKKYL